MIPALTSATHILGPSAAIGGLGSPSALGTVSGSPPAGSASFGSALQSAIGSVEQSQDTANAAAQGLATGTVTDPTQAVVAVENASLAMDVAAQVRDKLVSAENTIFQTQV